MKKITSLFFGIFCMLSVANAQMPYLENFEANFAPTDASTTFAPSTKAGTWSGGVNLQTDGDAIIGLDKGWSTNLHLLHLTPTSAAVTIPNINVAGYTNLSLSLDFTIAAATEAPKIDASVDGGAWAPLPTVAIGGGWWGLGTGSVALPAAVSTISLRINPATADAWFDNFAITGTATATGIAKTGEQVFSVYPNPATNYILTKNAQKVTILDLNGRVVKEAFNSEKVDIASLAKGAYIVKAQIDNATKIGKLIKE